MVTRICSRCKVEKSIDDFMNRKDRPYGKGYRCLECERKRISKNNKERYADPTKHEKLLESKRVDYSKNPDKYKLRNKEKYQKHREQILAGHKEYYQENKEARKKYSKEYRDRMKSSNPNWRKIQEMAYITKKSFEDVETWFNKQWMKQQAQCAICGKVFSDDDCIDHNHETLELRGLLCSNCNVGIGMLGDNPDTLNKASNYLLKIN